jgi:hypothetical protein
MAKATLRPATSDWGTPDPRDASAYPEPSTTTMVQWGWEFLRRRSDYRARWQTVIQPFIKDNGAWDQEAEDRQHDQASSLWDRRHSWSWVSPFERLRREFRISATPFSNHNLDPRSALPPFFDGLTVWEVSGNIGEVKPPRIVFEFDVRLPGDPQFAYAKMRFLEAAKRLSPPPRNVKPPTQKFQSYLRLLDFEEIRTRDNEIGRYLFLNKSGEALRDIVNKTSKAARRWQDDYLRIALHAPAAS